VPIPAGRKGPAEEGWQHLRISLDGVAQHFSAECNLGGILGPASGELVDVDLDCPKALALADQYLPPTQAIFGRRAKPKSHQLYIAPGAAFETFADPLEAGKNMLLELRAAGRDGGAHQTLLPPSVADHERREWHGEIIAPAVINSTILRTAGAWLAIGCLVRRHVGEYPSEHPGPDLPDLLAEADPKLGEAARRWLHLPEPGTERTVRLHPGRDMTADELDLAELVHAIRPPSPPASAAPPSPFRQALRKPKSASMAPLSAGTRSSPSIMPAAPSKATCSVSSPSGPCCSSGRSAQAGWCGLQTPSSSSPTATTPRSRPTWCDGPSNAGSTRIWNSPRRGSSKPIRSRPSHATAAPISPPPSSSPAPISSPVSREPFRY
jgi:hypothetical protein